MKTSCENNVPLKQPQGWGPTSTPLGITGSFGTPPQVIIEAWRLHPKSSPFKNKCFAYTQFCNRRKNFFTNEKMCGRTENIFTENFFRINELCDKKRGIKLTSLLNHITI